MSETGAKKMKMIVGTDEEIGQPSNQMEISSNGGKNVLFVVRLCPDVVLEVLCWGDRRELALLEKFGRRFHLLIDGSFKEAPFLLLALHIEPSDHSIRLSGKEICQAGLLPIPPFVRFNRVMLHYENYGYGPFGLECAATKLKEGCEWTQMIFQPLKPALKGAHFYFEDVCYNPMHLTHLEQELLPICDSCRSYRFKITFWSRPTSSVKELISTFFQFVQIDCCSNVLLKFTFHIGANDLIELPVDVVANWLNRRRSNAINADGQMQNERNLLIETTGFFLGNISEMIDCLKKAFLEALHPMQQFAFRVKFWRAADDKKIGCEEISNNKTGEMLSIVYVGSDDMYSSHTLDVERSKAEENKGNKNGGK